ncbi:hypothetical protein BJY00DRAFT_179922 [Aspergillus carlsbadensis]|nr:hypothetical protein BJY00DRAFT_179922 [Aspergillus carlsbadensis]
MAFVSDESSHSEGQPQHPPHPTGRIINASGLPPPTDDTTTAAANTVDPPTTAPIPSSTFRILSTIPSASSAGVPPLPSIPLRDHEGGFVQPSSYLRSRRPPYPMPPSQPERAIDREERQGLRAIRNFLK